LEYIYNLHRAAINLLYLYRYLSPKENLEGVF